MQQRLSDLEVEYQQTLEAMDSQAKKLYGTFRGLTEYGAPATKRRGVRANRKQKASVETESELLSRAQQQEQRQQSEQPEQPQKLPQAQQPPQPQPQSFPKQPPKATRKHELLKSKSDDSSSKGAENDPYKQSLRTKIGSKMSNLVRRPSSNNAPKKSKDQVSLSSSDSNSTVNHAAAESLKSKQKTGNLSSTSSNGTIAGLESEAVFDTESEAMIALGSIVPR